MLRYCRLTLTVLFVTGLSACASAESGPHVAKDKKLLAFACDLVNTRYLKENIAELERIPIDGLIISVHPDAKELGEGDLYLGRINLASGDKYKREDYQRAVAELKATKFNRFTDNFIDFSMCARNAYDWFDDRWDTYAHNAGVLASVAKQGGLKGLFIDTENYGGRNVPVPYPFSYSLRKDNATRSFEQVAEQVRKRGRQFMTEIVAEYPDITIMMHPDMFGSESDHSNLISAFIDGLLEAGPDATLIDAGGLAYDAMLYDNFVQMRKYAERRGPERSKAPGLYKRRMKYAYGLWVDSKSDLYGGWHTDPAEFDLNYRSPERLEHTLHSALTVSDRYVWLFMIHPQVWWQPHLLKKENVAKQMEYSSGWRCVLCPHTHIPEAYLDAIRNCREPHDLNWAPDRARGLAEMFYTYTPYLLKTIRGPRDLKGEHILLNGGFESWTRDAPDGWSVDETAAPFVSRNSDVAKDGASSMRAAASSATSHIYAIQFVPAPKYAGKTITFGVWTKSNFESPGSINVIDFIKGTGRTDEGAGKFTAHLADDGWTFLTATKTIRASAVGNVRFYLDSSLPAGGEIHYDGAVAVVRD